MLAAYHFKFEPDAKKSHGFTTIFLEYTAKSSQGFGKLPGK